MSENFQIDPYVGAGTVRLGMSRQEVLGLDLGPVRSFKRTSASKLPSDQFADRGVIVSYKLPEVVEAIELYPPAHPVYEGVDLFEASVSHVKALLLQKDPGLSVDCDGFVSTAMGIALHVDGGDEGLEELPSVKSVLIFERGYYG